MPPPDAPPASCAAASFSAAIVEQRVWGDGRPPRARPTGARVAGSRLVDGSTPPPGSPFGDFGVGAAVDQVEHCLPRAYSRLIQRDRWIVGAWVTVSRAPLGRHPFPLFPANASSNPARSTTAPGRPRSLPQRPAPAGQRAQRAAVIVLLCRQFPPNVIEESRRGG